MFSRVVLILAAALLAACSAATPSVAPTTAPASPQPSAPSAQPAAPVVASIQDFRQAVNAIANASPEKAQGQADALYNALLASKRIPLVFGQQVAFLYKGRANSVTWQGIFSKWGELPGLKGGRVGQTDLWIAQAEMPPASRFEYKIVLNEKEWILDPANPMVVPSNASDNSLLALPGFTVTDYSAKKSGVAAGSIAGPRTLASKNLGYSVQYWVYTPVGYENLRDLPVLYVTDGNDWVDSRTGALPVVMDNLIADGKIKPAIAVFIDERDPGRPDYNRREEEFLVHPEEYARFVAEELVPAVESAYRTTTAADHRAVVGVSYGGVIASFIAARYPEVFHNLAAFSPSMWVFGAADQFPPERTKSIKAMLPVMDSLTNCGGQTGVKCRTQPLKVFASSGFPDWDVGNLSPTADNLKARGHSVLFVQVQEGHAWSSWRGLSDEMLIHLDGTTP